MQKNCEEQTLETSNLADGWDARGCSVDTGVEKKGNCGLASDSGCWDIERPQRLSLGNLALSCQSAAMLSHRGFAGAAFSCLFAGASATADERLELVLRWG